MSTNFNSGNFSRLCWLILTPVCWLSGKAGLSCFACFNRRAELELVMSNERLALHEAAHAVIGRVLTLTCGASTIVPDADSEGHSVLADPWRTDWDWDKRGKFRETRSCFRGRIMAYMAGAEAEIVFFGDCAGGDGDDRWQISMMAASDDTFADEAQWDRYEPRMRRHVRNLVRRHKTKIERVAKALLERRTLSAEEIDALMMEP